MVANNNSEISREIIDALQSQLGAEGMPTKVSDTIQLSVEVNPKLLRRCDIIKQVSSASTIYTTPADKDFFVNTVHLGIAKDVADTGTAASITCVVNGATVTLLTIPGITLTADAQNVVIPFPVPIKVDRNTAVAFAVAGSYTAVRASITGFLSRKAYN